jgi:hypothetical protein
MGSKRSHVVRFYGRLKIFAGRTARELWWTSQELSPAGIIITMALQAHISPGG